MGTRKTSAFPPATMPAASTSAFAEHTAWLRELHAKRQRFEQGYSLPEAPMSWAFQLDEGHQESNDFLTGSDEGGSSIGESFEGIALSDEHFEPPVYRSLGGFLPADGALDFADFDEPVYRSLGLAAAAPAQPMSRGAPLSDEAERTWLESMPPLIRRQNAHGMSI